MITGIFNAVEELARNAGIEMGTIKENMDNICEVLEEEILKSETSEEEKKAMLKRLRTFCNTETNIMLVGGTGCGKSSTINALFSCGNTDNEEDADYVEIAKVGIKADPETKDIEKYTI